ncbi:hypothetical protein R6Z07F_007687 [Ovis aries]
MAETLQIRQDTRSFILKKPKLSEELVVTANQESGMMMADALRALSGHLVQTRDLVQPDKPASPKFIVTLNGVPSPPGYMSDQEEDMCSEGMRPAQHPAASHGGLATQQLHMLSRQLEDPDGSFANAELSELSVAQKPEKLLERCKYWPACKNGDECAYHHPVLPCKAFPNCKFAEKCLSVHPNCKYDCPFTHMNRRTPGLPPKPVTAAAPPSSSQLRRYFPACKKMECPFYHPKHCRFNTQCARPDCTFYHPTITVPPQRALKWIRPQTSQARHAIDLEESYRRHPLRLGVRRPPGGAAASRRAGCCVSGHRGLAPPSRSGASPLRAAKRRPLPLPRQPRHLLRAGPDRLSAPFSNCPSAEAGVWAEGASEGGEARGKMRPQAEGAAAGAAGF